MEATKLSKLQKFILTEALKTWSTKEQRAKTMNSMITGLKPDAVPIQADNLAHVGRNHILIAFFGLSLRKWRWQGVVQDDVIERIDWEAAGPKVFNRANASFYHSIGRLERRGLVKPMTKGGWRLTPQGLSAARKLSEEQSIGAARYSAPVP